MQDERTRKAAEIAKLQEQLQESRKQQAADEGLSSEAASLAQQRADELAASQQKVASLEEKIGALQMEISRGREERNSAGQLQKKLEGANAELAFCREELDRQRKSAIEAVKARASLEAQLQQKEEKVDALTQAVSKAEVMAPAPAPAPADLPLREFLASEGLDDLHDPLHELGAELLSDLADVTDAEFTECGIPPEKGKWLRGQAQAVRGGGSGGGGGAAGIPEGVPKEDDGV